MKVSFCENVDVEGVVDVDFDDVLSELSVELESADKDKALRRAVSVMDRLTRILAAISDETIAAMKPEHAAVIRDRLLTESARWPVVTADVGSK